MGVFDQLQSVLQQYSSGAPAQDHAQAEQHFDQVASAAPPSSVAEGLAAAFRSNQTPDFSEMIGSLFNKSDGEQKAGILNQLMASAGPQVLAGLGGGALAGLMHSGGQVSPEQAQQVSPEAVQQLAEHAEKSDSSIIDQCSAFYAQHPTLVKTLGGAALSLAMMKIAQNRQG